MTTVAANRAASGRPAVWPLTVEAYHALGEAGLIPEDTELLYGIVYRKMSKSPLHSRLLMRLLRMLSAQVPAGFSVRPEQPLTLGTSEPEPDLAVVAGSEDAFPNSHPATAELVIEICVSSYDYDFDKLRAYAAAGVKEVWLVRAAERRVEIHRSPRADGYAETTAAGGEEMAASAALPTVKVPLAGLFRA
ncbi:MAG: Uma2 family endonuclease [Limisphaerales bacterium]